MELPLFLIIDIALGVVVLVLLTAHLLLRRRIRAFLKGSSGASLEDVLAGHTKKIERLEHETKKHFEEIAALQQNLSRAFQKAEVMRYDSLEAGTGNQSFSVALLDGERSGLVLTNLHLRDTIRLYVKPIEQGRSRYKLSEEEESVLKKAMRS